MFIQRPDWSLNWLIWKSFSANLYNHLNQVYLVFAIFSVILMANITPAFQAPDERNHFLRAEQVSRGVFVAEFIYQQAGRDHHVSPDKRIIYPDSGGYIGNKGIVLCSQPYDEIKFHPEKKVNNSLIQSSKIFHWKADPGVIDFQNTAIYPPVGYTLSAIGIMIGKWTHMSIVDTLIFSRIVNGIGCAIICFIALGLAGRSRLLLFFVLLLPLTISLFASVSQDAMLISLTSLMVGLIDHIESSEKRMYTIPQLAFLIFSICFLSTARPPYILLIFVFLFLQLTPKMKLYSIVIPLILIAFWGLLNMNNYAVSFAPAEMRVNANLQMAYVLEHPFRFLALFFHFNYEEITDKIREFIGVLGWLDLFLPNYYYKLAYFVFFLTGISSIQFKSEKWKIRTAIILTAFFTFIGILVVQYITWMPLENPGLGGFQSRYFIPVFLFMAIGFAGFRKENSMKDWQIPIFLVIVVFPLISQVIVVNSIIARYYLN